MKYVRPIAYFICTLVFVMTVLMLALNIHEIGHTLVAQLSGDHGARYFLYRHDAARGTCLGCNIYDASRLSYMGNVAVTVGGVVTTQLVAVALLVWSSRQKRYSLRRRTSLVAAVIFSVDAPLQVFQAIIANVGTQRALTRVDLADTLYLVAQRIPASPTALKVILACALFLYMVLLIRLYIHVNRPKSP